VPQETRRLLVFGATGQLSRALKRTDWPSGIAPTFLDRAAADLAEPDLMGRVVKEHAPDAVIIAAAYTQVDEAERDEDGALAVNCTSPTAIAAAAATRSVPVVYLSTDYVFDGTKAEAYREADPVGPINSYGRSKLVGERGVKAANPRHLILRTSWVYSANGRNFLRAMVEAASSGQDVATVVDQRGCPTAAPDLARAIARIAPRLFTPDMPWGTYHLAGGSDATWHDFAEAIFTELAARGYARPRNRQALSAEMQRLARRPANSRLCCAAFADQFGFALPGFENSMPAVLDELFGDPALRPRC